MGINEILEYNFINVGNYSLSLLTICQVIFVLIFARFLAWLSIKIISRGFQIRQIDQGRQYAVRQFMKYIIYTLAILYALHYVLGINLTLLWGGSAALLVGIGLGLQQFFMNLISGVILLVEGSVDVGDIVVVDNLVAKVLKIGIRTSQVETRDSIVILVPNSKLVGENVINWSHNRKPSRFQVHVGVAYASNVNLTIQSILEVAGDDNDILKAPEPDVHFAGFGDSSLDFILHFYSSELWRIEKIKSNLRIKINEKFRENNIEIPFPQRDLWLRNTGKMTIDP